MVQANYRKRSAPPFEVNFESGSGDIKYNFAIDLGWSNKIQKAVLLMQGAFKRKRKEEGNDGYSEGQYLRRTIERELA